MSNQFSSDRASEYRRTCQPLEAGRLIFETLPSADRPRWAGRILELAVHKSGLRVRAIESLRGVIQNPSAWSEGHRVFSSLRTETLKLERRWWRTARRELLLHLLCLAENVAKVVYNATDPPDEFDED